MSITRTAVVDCPCGAPIEAFLADSLNAGRHPQLRELILSRRLHVFVCGFCREELTVEKELTYFDYERRQLIGVFPSSERQRERACAELVMRLYEGHLRSGAPSLVREVAGEFLVRLCFGYEELREKLVCDDAGLSDSVLEALKCDLLPTDPGFARAGVITLRLDGVEPAEGGGRLRFLPEQPGGALLSEPVVWVKRELYDATLAREGQILSARPGLASGPHVSLLRLIEWPKAA